jgi:nucleoside-diphosphate-sugar epimerase
LSKVLVTGVSGCIGAWVAKLLVEEGDEVVGADVSTDRSRVELVMGPLVKSPRLSFVELDIRDTQAVERACAQGQFDAVVHLAALQLPFCKADPINGAMVNLLGMLNFLQAARSCPFRFVYASSTAVYGPSIGRDIAEDENLLPHSLYGVFKRTDEEMARVYWQDWGVESAGLRPWIVYGPARDQGLTADITLALKAAALRQAFQIRFAGGVQVAHAEEVARAFICAARKSVPGGRVYTLGGLKVPVPQVIDAIHAVTGTSSLVTHAETDLPIAHETTDAAYQSDFGPFGYMRLEDGLTRTLNVWRERGLLPPASGGRA